MRITLILLVSLLMFSCHISNESTEKEVTCDPTNTMNSARELAKKEKFQDAIEALNKCESLDKNITMLIMKAAYHYQLNEYELALETYNKILVLDNDNPVALYKTEQINAELKNQ